MYDPEAPTFTPGATGWVVRVLHERIDTWWYGPARGWGTTSGKLDDSVALFPTRRAAETALRSVYGAVRSAAHHVERTDQAVEYAVGQARRRAESAERSDVRQANLDRIAYLTQSPPKESP